ncbi:early nodulin-like protein 1 [Mangifera indica]|uniref:early nodulin-like protein 1 n=1 Tax=Mangifera indica TaxID=29780 RepID=UPI001CFB31B5|nr:early nodulin-like protein 1 [Mangifera indica]
MEFKRFYGCLFLMLLGLVSSSQGYKFYVGGKDGWVLNPSENYNHWAERMRFQVNDTLYFKYNKESNSVLVVNNHDYYSCNTKNPIQSLSDGDSIFHLNRSGPYYFISGNAADNCKKGQKVIIVVMAVRHHHRHAPPSPSPAAAPPLSPAPHPTLSPPEVSPTPLSTPAEPPKSGGSVGLASSVGSLLGFSVVASVVLGSLMGVF